MRKLYALSAFLIGSVALSAQVNLTVNVDMNAVTVSENGVHLAGDFGNGNPVWNPGNAAGAIELTDPDMDGIYSVTIQVMPNNAFECKTVNSNDWDGGQEEVPADCSANTNRILAVGGEDTTVDYPFAGCNAAITNAIKFNVDMSASTVSAQGVKLISGLFGDVNDSATWKDMSDDDGDGVYSYVHLTTADEGEVAFKFSNGTSILSPENLTGLECANEDGLRTITQGGVLTETNAICFGQCGICATLYNATLRVNTSQIDVTEGMHIAGNFNSASGLYTDWSPGDIDMTDDDSDEIYEFVMQLPNGTYEFKFVANADGWENGFGVDCQQNGNRFFTIEDGDITYTACYNQCSEECEIALDPANITFRVDMSNQIADGTLSADGVFLIGGFTDPAWQDGATAMTDADADGVYEATLEVAGPTEFFYKFVNGDVSVTANEEDNVEMIGDCATANPFGGINRVHARSGEVEVLTDFCYNSCTTCIVSVDELGAIGAVSVFPNPATDQLNVSFETLAQEVVVLQLVDAMGKIVFNKQINVFGNVVEQIELDGLSSGLYNLSIQSQGNRTSTPVVVK